MKDSLSLNDCVCPGLSELEEIPSLLLRSRLLDILVASDIEKVFLQVREHKSQRDLLRFLWIRNTEEPLCKENIIQYSTGLLSFHSG